jgi:small subunit ribosomal protein S10
MTIKLRVTLKAFDYKLLNNACKKIFEVFENTESEIMGPIYLPTKTKRFCVLRSPHVNKDSREHFEIKFYKRFIDINTDSALASDKFLRLKLPSGVSVFTKMR